MSNSLVQQTSAMVLQRPPLQPSVLSDVQAMALVATPKLPTLLGDNAAMVLQSVIGNIPSVSQMGDIAAMALVAVPKTDPQLLTGPAAMVLRALKERVIPLEHGAFFNVRIY